MAVPVVEASNSATADSTSVTVTTPANNDGDILFGIGVQNSSSDLAEPSGFTLTDELADTSGSNVSINVSGKTCSSEPSTHDFTSDTSKKYVAGLVTISGAVLTPNAFDIASGSGSTITCPAITTTADDCLIIRCCGIRQGANITANPGTLIFTQMSASGNRCGVSVAYGELATAGDTGTATFTQSTTDNWRAYTIAYEPAGGGGGGDPEAIVIDGGKLVGGGLLLRGGTLVRPS